jgi:hypothetical protein
MCYDDITNIELGMYYDIKTNNFIKSNSNNNLSIPEPTQLDRIESMILKSQEQITKEARDAYTLELINSGII